MIRLDKFLSDTLPCTRREAARYIKEKRVTVNGKIAKGADTKLDEKSAAVAFDGQKLSFSKFIYIMLNKPAGLVSATEDEREKTVMSCLPESYMTKGLFPAGRLDKDTTGLLLLTNDGETAHRLLSPKYNKKKIYKVTAELPFTEKDTEKLKSGIMLDEGRTKPVELEITEDKNVAFMTLTEGKFHEVKRICMALGNRCTALMRVSFAGLPLDESLAHGEWRNLTEAEVAQLIKISKEKG